MSLGAKRTDKEKKRHSTKESRTRHIEQNQKMYNFQLCTVRNPILKISENQKIKNTVQANNRKTNTSKDKNIINKNKSNVQYQYVQT